VREILEETGLGIALGAPLGTVEYVLPSGRDKVVHYWSAEIDEHALELATFTPNAEIAALEWLPLDKARKKLTYPHDVDIIDRFAARLADGRARTFAIITVRHGKAVAPTAWDGPDSTRPLMQRGADQSATIAPGIAAYAPRKIISSTATRCLATVAPLSRLTALDIRANENISQDAFELGRSAVTKVVSRRLAKRKTAVLCSHGPVIPEILSELVRLTDTAPTAALREAASLATGEFSVAHISLENSRGGIVAIETHSSGLT
jgi:8-oxo-dGTP diphosphatase